MANTKITGKHQAGWITIPIDEYESMKETIEVSSDADIMNQLEDGKKKDILVRDFEDLAKELGI